MSEGQAVDTVYYVDFHERLRKKVVLARKGFPRNKRGEAFLLGIVSVADCNLVGVRSDLQILELLILHKRLPNLEIGHIFRVPIYISSTFYS